MGVESLAAAAASHHSSPHSMIRRVDMKIQPDYVEDIYIMVLSVLVPILNSNHMYLPLLLTVYCIVLYTNKLCTTMSVQYNGGLLPDIILYC